MTKELNTKAKYKAIDIARVILANDPKREYFTNDSIGNFRLQTMLHISQMLYCAKTGKPLFKDPMYAFPPRWELLNDTNQKKLFEYYFNPGPEVNKDNKRQLIYDLYKQNQIEFTHWDNNYFEEEINAKKN